MLLQRRDVGSLATRWRVVFVDTNAPRRRDEAFRNGEYGLHQTGTTPLIELPNFDIIEGIISCERLHQIDIGPTENYQYLKSYQAGKERSAKHSFTMLLPLYLKEFCRMNYNYFFINCI
uniref:Uncharacterized protein n=1 Tax=Anopheles dirus TaxID=7168 RepID=A0A182N9N5_9DIPT